MSRRPRVYYFGMITTDAYGHAVGERIYSGAATRKMLLVAAALRSAGHLASVVSLPFVGTKATRAGYRSILQTEQGVPVAFLPTLRSKYLRKVVGPLVLACFAARRVRRGDTVILYNHAVEYLPALLACRLRGVRLVQDIEDAPTDEERGLRGILNRFSFVVTSRVTVPRKMVVSDHVAEALGLKDFVTIRGVAAHETGAAGFSDTAKWRELRDAGPLKLHFGGSLMTETGIDLFCEMVEELVLHVDRLSRNISFKITGVGELDKIRALQDRIGLAQRVAVEMFPELEKADYLALIDSCHGSLSLKRPGSAMSNTTFPSKVIEITSAGLALVSARLGDVSEIFDNETAFFIPEYRPEDLAEVIITMAADPERVERVAVAGRDLCNEVFSPAAVGAEMKRLL